MTKAPKSKRKQAKPVVLRPHHSKPYRKRHVTSLTLALLAVIVITLELGVVIGDNRRSAPPVPAAALTSPAGGSVTTVRSSYGFSFSADANSFDITANESGPGAGQVVSSDQLDNNQPIIAATVSPKPGAVSGQVAATQFSVQVNPDAGALTTARQQPQNAGLNANQVAATFFPLAISGQLTSNVVSSAAGSLNGMVVQKTVYKFTDQQGGGTSYAIVWSGVTQGRAFAVKLNGLVGGPGVPAEFAPVIASLSFSTGPAVLGASTNPGLDSEYLSDALSPAVVQIFHTVCGILTINGEQLGGSSCVSFSGSGFLTTSNGYVATNGHVVVYSAQDALAGLITSNPGVLAAYLHGLGLTSVQINATQSDPAALAAQISKIYDLSDAQLRFSNQRDLILVALGNDQPSVQKLANLTTSAQLAQFKYDTTDIKSATLVGYNYSAKDAYTAIADPTKGFSSSDVALLKINVKNAPTIPIETGQVVQNENIMVMGFPGDANNPLVDNSQSDLTVTDGVVSAIRQAAGDDGKLYQSNADAAHGNSGGPAIDGQGRVIGLLTYRYSDGTNANAPESYIRDIADFNNLATSEGVTINSNSTTQQWWAQGLELYSRSHYLAALKDFGKVQAAYPAQRLVASYISSSKQAIAAGKNVTIVPVALLLVILAVSLIAVGAITTIIIRHHGLHRIYQASQTIARAPLIDYLSNEEQPELPHHLHQI
jgi:hypothetical protein